MSCTCKHPKEVHRLKQTATGKVSWGACTDSRCNCLKFKPDEGQPTIAAATATIVITRLAHQVAKLHDGADNADLVAAVHAHAADTHPDLPYQWVYIGERQTDDGWEQYWLPILDGGGS